MAVFKVTDPETGVTLQLTGDSPPTEQELEEIFAQQAAPVKRQGLGDALLTSAKATFGSIADTVLGTPEAALSVGTGIAAAVPAGIAGLAQTLNPFAEEGAGEQATRSIQEALTFQPRSERGKAALEGVAGVGEVLDVPGQFLGDVTLEATGSPAAATAARMAPDIIMTALGFGAAKRIKAPGQIKQAEDAGRAAGLIDDAGGLTDAGVAEAAKTGAPTVFRFQTPTRKKITEILQRGGTEAIGAKFKLIETGQGARAARDSTATNAVKQGFDEGVIAPIRQANNATKNKLRRMAEVMERGKADSVFAAKNRPSDIVGDSLLERYKSVVAANRRAGGELNGVAAKLKGRQVDLSEPVSAFADDLDSFGVALIRDKDGRIKASFEDSSLAPGDRGPIKEVVRQMSRLSRKGDIDAFDAHELKRIIDRNVTFGKTKTGLGGDAERALGKFRTNLDNSLDIKFPEYNRVNTVFSETRTAMDSLQDVAGQKLNLEGPNADKAVGTLLRRVISNAQSRSNLIDSIEGLEAVAQKHGGSGRLKIEGAGGGSDDLITQILFADELDRVFGPVARASFQGQIDQALKQGAGAVTSKAGALDAALSGVGKLAEKARGINEEGAFKAIRELLRERGQ